jgi:hypothetical protein
VRFVPVDDDQEDPIIVTETVYVPAEERLSKTQEMVTEITSSVIVKLIEDGVQVAKPHVQRWWNETAVPFTKAKAKNWKHRRSLRHAEKAPQGVEEIVIDDATSSSEESSSISILQADERPTMSSAEAQAHLLAAVAARAYSDEQLRMVSDSQIIDTEDSETIRSTLAQIPREHLIAVIEHMTRHPHLLEESNLANLASFIGRVNQVDNVPVDGMTNTE